MDNEKPCRFHEDVVSKLEVGTQVQILNRHQTILCVYVNKFGKNSVVCRYTLQSIGPSGIALNY